ncbi:sulfatase-like hydrolase/transferase [Prevotella copri]|uniref:Sulfatase-like hydrolase/transferase n=1 Tax=Segatella copri TaxID=165179 RepID=A0AAW5IJB0_9BACT|nr:alkaline phosphatase family protein [Segatella copri]MCP9533745.1 sulfatase-like hydrolase/transferase [Segatella copri]MCP9536453.1 sulfatase-like hydrolase/transferase [Segatella copri]MCP9539673.1 sulfatase-like hydrolase/transferase [Segatella copri]MCP9557745.1 sulfatase-like hydrolase/transferase [Segatella copri]MCP9560740.1 sulfatase-like hydrolase/transferase [Segatella copri]
MKQIIWFVKTYATFVVLFVLQKPLFLFLEKGSATQPVDNIFTELPAVIWHGLPLDLSMAGYLSVIPGFLSIAVVWLKRDLVKPIMNIYFIIASLFITCSFLLNASLYPYWKYPLDSTPLFYFFTSPADAIASVSIWQVILSIVILIVLTIGVWLTLRMRGEKRQQYSRYSYGYGGFGSGKRNRFDDFDRHRGRTSIILLLLTGLLFLPIRGGITVSTMNTGQAYYSQNAYLNHSAVNPLFSLLESITHQEDFASQYRFMKDKEADKIFATMTSTSDENTYPLLNEATFKKGTPDILIVIMESFASDIMPSMGSYKDVAVCLDSIAQQSILFTRFYANSFRTDRGMVSILSGYPAQPTTSIMRYPRKTSQLPSIARNLAKYKNYKTTYYYGGDADFCNMRSYLVSQGYQHIISDANFPIEDKLSKWGVPDHILAAKMMEDIKAQQNEKRPMLRILQTSSSHEPFEVPYHRLKDKRLNAFAYTDSVMGAIVREYRKLPRWKNTLIVFVPDHVGGYKENLNDHDRSRYQIPLILAGGAISRPMKVGIIGSQHDIAATLLGQLGVEHREFTFSKNMMSDATPKFAFFAVNDAFGIVSEENSLIYDNRAKRIVYDKGEKGFNLKRGQAYLQKLYDDLAKK